MQVAIKLTARQQQILDLIQSAIARTGAPPTRAEIAAELGFTEPSAFHRAFRKWTGTSPGAFRRDVNTGQPEH